MFLLDTNVVSELRRAAGGRAAPQVVAWAVSVPASAQFVSVLTLCELETGLLRVGRNDPGQATALRRWLDEAVVPGLRGRILPVDEAVARRAAAFHVPDPAPPHDALIAATALVHGMTVVTRDVADFARFDGVRLLDPWDGAGAA
jgi:predicted nucleic acid-binding protein